MKNRLHQTIVESALQKPRQGQRRNEIIMPPGDIDDLMRNRRPEHRQAVRLDLHLAAAQQVGNRSMLQQVQLDFVVAIRPAHQRRCPSLAGEAVWREIGPARIEMHRTLGYRHI